MATIERKSQSFSTGCLIGVIGVVMIGTGIAIPRLRWLLIAAGLVLIVVGHLKSYVWYCSACGNTVRDRDVKVCPVCRESLAH